MKIRMIALAGVAALALTAPAVASDATGWYLGLGVGWDNMRSFNQTFTGGPAPTRIKTETGDSALIAGAVGYRFASHWRIEDEIGWDRHDVKDPFSGRASILSDMLNVVWDIPLSDRWDLSLGAGAGVGRLNVDTSIAPLTYLNGKHVGFMYQFIGGFAYSVSDNLDLTLDYRYRSVSVNKDYGTSFVLYNARARDTNEQVAMIGLRWYLESAPPPPPPPPPPVKTFIVFFDFNKSNLTAEAQSVVAQAASTAKSTGMVKILVTGHTDTVGSHSYNQALSERRAAAVKDGLVSQGIDGAGISTVGKSFDDPLVPTGPNVREPQNRRAVIQLGEGSGT